MNRKYTLLLCGTMLSLTLAGCQNQSSEKSTEAPAAETAAETDTAAEDVTEAVTEDLSEISETEASLEPITPSDYLVSDAADYVTLGSYDAIPVEMTTYEITDDMVQERIEEELELNADEIEKKGAAEEGDTLYFDLTYTEQGTDDTTSEEDYYTVLGYEEFGEEFDSHLTGASAGDTLTFSIEYDDDDMMIDWAGKTMDFTVNVTSVCTLEVPEYNDEYIKNSTEYETKDDYEASIRNSLEMEYEDMSYSETIDSLFAAALDRTEFSGYPQDLYDSCKEETLDYYRMFAGDATEEELCDMIGITEEDLDADVVSAVNQKLLVSAYCLANDITVTEDEYVSFLEDYASYYGAPDAVSFEEYYGRSSLVWALYDSKFTDALYDSADITEVPYDPSDYETEEFEEDELDASIVEAGIDEEEDTAGETETDLENNETDSSDSEKTDETDSAETEE